MKSFRISNPESRNTKRTVSECKLEALDTLAVSCCYARSVSTCLRKGSGLVRKEWAAVVDHSLVLKGATAERVEGVKEDFTFTVQINLNLSQAKRSYTRSEMT
jgi:hypothetical protein